MHSRREILKENINLFKIFKISAKYDSISFEWIHNYPITFDIGYPYFIQQLKEINDVNIATVHTFLKILSKVPDTLIARKVGLDEAKRISIKAKEILKMGGLRTSYGKKKLWEFDKELQDPNHRLNPGTTADITAAVLAIVLLEEYRP